MMYPFCPILLEKFEYPRTNGQSKAGVSNLEIPAHYYRPMGLKKGRINTQKT